MSTSLRSGEALRSDKATRRLEDVGVEKFGQPFDNLMKALARKLSRS